jgi:hypothetical protein
MKKILCFPRLLFLFSILVCINLYAQDVKFKIVKTEDFSYANVKRIQYRISLYKDTTKNDIKHICDQLINNHKTKNLVNAITFLFYSPGSGTDGAYTAGTAVWAPNGKWGDAGKVKTGDYSKHKLEITIGSALGEYKPKKSTKITIEKRKKIFYDLIVEQDKGVGDSKAYEIIAKRYKLDIKIVREIAVEGVMNNWPMP